ASKQQARYAVGRCLMLWSSNDVTQQGSRPKTKLAPLKTRFIHQAHVYSNGIQFLKRCSALGLPFLRASPAWAAQVSSIFGLQPLRSKRKQLLFW
ncbi:hypothetical protein, partial [Pseudomonas aeruginosa]